MDLWLHAQISDMMHQKVIMADIVWPIFKWPLNNHGHGLLENNPGRPIFELLRASSVYLEPFLYFVPGMKWLHAVAVGWMYLIGVAEVLGGVDTGPCCQKDSLYRPVPCLSIQIPERQCTAMYYVDTGPCCQKGSQYSKSTLSLATDSVKKVLNMLRLTGKGLQYEILRHKIHFLVFL